jgi:hypothetical protein
VSKKSKSESQPTTSAAQQEVERAVADLLLKGLPQGATPYGGQTVAGIPDLFTEAYSRLSGELGQGLPQEYMSALDKVIGGTPAYQFDPAATTKRWQETYAGPLMQTWQETVAPMVSEAYNLPGVFSSTLRGQGIGRAAGEFLGGQVAPTLFSSLQQGEQLGAASRESAASRILSGLGMGIGLETQLPYQQFGQAAGASDMLRSMLNQIYGSQQQEAMRLMPEYNPYMQAAMGFATAPTQQTVATQGYSPWGDIAGMAGMALGGPMGAGIGNFIMNR